MRWKNQIRTLALAGSLLALFAPSAWAQGKLALIIGNGAYQNATELPNPPNDATDMDQVLRAMGFDVVSAINATKQDMDGKIREFAEKAETADVALFFYAGHGMQVNGVNYLIPVDAKLETQTALDFETVNAESIIRYMSSDTRVGLVFLDACRDNPLSRRFQKKSRSAAVGSGLATRTGSDPNLLIAFATAPGEVALDGIGRNSPFTSALIKYLPQSNKELRSVLTDVKADVQLSTKREQIPWSHDNLVTNLYLNGGGDAPVAAVQETTPPAVVKDPQQDEARLAWEAVKDTTSVAALDLVATRYDGTLYAVLAKTRAVELRDEAKRKAAKAAEQQATLNDPEEPSAPPKTRVKPQATRSSLSWGVILGSYPKANATKARARMRAARAEGLNAQLINTDNYGRLTPGLYAVVIGASSRSEALSLAQDAQSVFADAYAKQLQ